MGYRKTLQFSLGAFGINMSSITLGIVLLSMVYCVPGAERVDKLAATTLIALMGLIEVILDPVVGHLAEKMRGSGKRYVMFMLSGSFLKTASFVLLLLPPSHSSPERALLYLIIFRTLYFIGFNIYSIPYDSLLSILGRDERDRVSLSGYKNLFAQVGVLLATLLIGLLSSTGLKPVIIAIAALSLLTEYAALTRIKIRAMVVERERFDIFTPYRTALSSKDFMRVFLCGLAINVGRNALLANNEYVTQLIAGQKEGVGTVIVGATVVVMLIAAAIFIRLSRKHKPLILFKLSLAGFALSCLYGFTIGKFGLSPMVGVIVTMVLVAVFMTGCYTSIYMVLAGLVSAYRSRKGKSCETQFFGVFAMVYGLGSAFGFVLIGLSHRLGDTSAESFGIRFVFVVLFLILLAGFLVASGIKPAEVDEGSINEDRQCAIRNRR